MSCADVGRMHNLKLTGQQWILGSYRLKGNAGCFITVLGKRRWHFLAAFEGVVGIGKLTGHDAFALQMHLLKPIEMVATTERGERKRERSSFANLTMDL